ncbi:hypothetical protein DL93DRAFT_2028777, partial [Clavulina sp. PMI_390]
CLPGTRTAILGAIHNWAVGETQPLDCPTFLEKLVKARPILWLCGVAGSGKSSIAMSVALKAQEDGYLGAYYHFSRSNQAQLRPSNLFTTIAHQLACQNKAAKEQLARIVKDCDSFTLKSNNPAEQLRTFVLPLLNLATTAALLVPIIIVIDAIDESGSISDRKGIIQCLTQLGASLPPSIRVLITSRFESDLQD